MDRFKWFDFLGALILLLSVTKSALTPQGVINNSDNLEASSVSTGQEADLYQSLSEGNLDAHADTINSSVKPFFEGDSRRLSIQDGVVGDRNSVDNRFLYQVPDPSWALEIEDEVDSLKHPFALGYSPICSSSMVPVLIQ
jgi:hypothetical protein